MAFLAFFHQKSAYFTWISQVRLWDTRDLRGSLTYPRKIAHVGPKKVTFRILGAGGRLLNVGHFGSFFDPF